MAARRASKEAKEEQGSRDNSLFTSGGSGSAEAKLKQMQSTLEELDKRFGEGTIVRLGDAQHMAVDSIPSGSLTVDIAIGIGGIPRGRVTEIYGPESSGKTTLCLHLIAEAQKRGGLAAFVDMEHALDPAYAQRIGVNIDKLYVSQPDTAEQALEITESLVRSGALDVVVLDSVAALVPRVEIEGEMGDSHVGIQARLMSQALRKLSGAIKQSNVAVLFTNQLRDKIGVMYGCFDESARVLLADGTTEAIRTLVEERRDVEVLSYNARSRQFEPRRVVNWFDNGEADEFLQVEVAADTGTRAFACTPNHHLLTPEGYEEAGSLKVGDVLMTSVPFYLNSLHEQIALGSLLGTGRMIAGKHSAQLAIAHNGAQAAYGVWKQQLFSGLIRTSGQREDGSVGFTTLPMYELRQLANLVYGENGMGAKQVIPEMLCRLGRLAVAVWYMDSGTLLNNFVELDTTDFSADCRQLLVDWLGAQGMDAKNDASGKIVFTTKKAVEKFLNWIACYVHPSMAHKLTPELRGQFRPLESDPCEHLEAVPMPILRIEPKPKTDGANMHRYDLEVQGNHCYLVDGVVVHNSPETTSGGRALKFYASVRLDVRKLESLKGSGGEVIGARTRIRVTKNKVAPPFREAEFDIMFLEKGISKAGEILDLGTELGIVEKRGAFFRYNDGLLGQGRENAKQYLMENPAISEEIESSIRVHYGMVPGVPAAAPASMNGADEDGAGLDE